MTSIDTITTRLRTRNHAIIEIDSDLQACYRRILDLFPAIPEDSKRHFSFFEETDGFIAHGNEYSMVPERPDLCERFCYWVSRREAHDAYPFSQSSFYRAISAYETRINAIAQAMIDGLCDSFGVPRHPPVRTSSYLQLCVYHPDYQSDDREFLQDPHEDGHLLSFIYPDREGLVIEQNGQWIPVSLKPNQMIALVGSLLQRLSDGAIKAQLHAVRRPSRPIRRMSMMYFVNPDLQADPIGFLSGQPVDLKGLAQQRHLSFGNRALKSI